LGEIEHLPVGAVAQEDHGTSNQQLFELKAISGNLGAANHGLRMFTDI